MTLNPLRHLQTENGLSSNNATCFHQDYQGFMWIGTNEGLCRFDGLHFRNYFQNPKDPVHSLSGNWINGITAYQQKLFIATNHGISVFDLEKQEFDNHFFIDERFNYRSRELFNFIIQLGDKWYVGGENKLYALRGDFSVETDITDIIKQKKGIAVRDFLPPIQDEHGRILFASCGELIQFSPATEEVRTTQEMLFNYAKPNPQSCSTAPPLMTHEGVWFFPWGSNPQLLHTNHIENIVLRSNNPVYDGSTNALYLDDKNNLWFATESGLFRRNKSGSIQEYTLESNSIIPCYQVYQDNKKNIWIATSQGVYYTTEHSANWIINNLPQTTSKKNVYVQDMAYWQNSLWINTNESEISSVYQLKNDQLVPVPIQGLEKGVRSIYPWDDEHLFIGGWKNAVMLHAENYAISKADFIPETYRDFPIIKTLRDHHNQTWLSFGQYNGILRLQQNLTDFDYFTKTDQPNDQQKSLPISSAYDMSEDHEGNIWMVRSKLDGKLVYWNPSTDSFHEIHPSNTESANMNYNGESYSVVAHDEAIWFAVMREGLFRYDKKTNTIEQFTRNDGLLSNDIYALEVDKNGVVWMGTAQGLAAMSYPGKTVTHFTSTSGLPDQNFSSASLYVEDIDKMFFSSNGTLLSFSPEALLRPTAIPELYLTGIRVEGKETGMMSREFRADENHIDFMFTAVDLYHAEGFEYRYRLVGLEDTWNEAGKNKIASYANIPAGNYTLLVSVKTLGEWSEPKMLYQFHLPQYFYKTWWFITSLALLFCLAVYGVYLTRIRRLKHLESIRNRISRDLHDDIGSALSSIRILSGQRKTSDDQDQEIFRRINRSSQQMLDNMDDIIWAIQPDQDSGEQLMIRMREFASEVIEGAGMNCRIEMDDRIERLHFDMTKKRSIYLIFKEAINNAAKYSQATEVTVKFTLHQQNHLRLEVIDDGIGFDPIHTTKGNGLKNIPLRCKELGGECKIDSAPQHGTKIAVEIDVR
jgi:ligand-binding sensor domain-containing protein/two-component sensor histidine kinase